MIDPSTTADAADEIAEAPTRIREPEIAEAPTESASPASQRANWRRWCSLCRSSSRARTLLLEESVDGTAPAVVAPRPPHRVDRNRDRTAGAVGNRRDAVGPGQRARP